MLLQPTSKARRSFEQTYPLLRCLAGSTCRAPGQGCFQCGWTAALYA